MMRFKITAVWKGRSNESRIVDQTVEAIDACDALEHALPPHWTVGQYVECSMEIMLIREDEEVEKML